MDLSHEESCAARCTDSSNPDFFFFFLLIRQLFVSAALRSHLNTISNFDWKGLFEVYGRHRSVESLNIEGPQPVFIIIITKIQAKFIITRAWGRGAPLCFLTRAHVFLAL